jgi:hypothetical protein
MKRFWIACLMAVLGVAGLRAAQAQSAPAQSAPVAPQDASSALAPAGPLVPDAAPGVFTAQQRGPARFHLVVTGHAFTSRETIEKYLAYRAAKLTMDQHFSWFSFVESRAKGDKAPLPKPDPSGPRYSFRLEFFRPVWRYKTAAAPAMQRWSPFSGAAFFANGSDSKGVTQYEVSADIVLHKGMVADDNPLAFDASALSQFLANQVAPPQ